MFLATIRNHTGACGNFLKGLKERGHKKQVHVNWIGTYIKMLKAAAFR
jgi:hypothetical protein